MATCTGAREECLNFDTYLLLDKNFNADPDIAGIRLYPALHNYAIPLLCGIRGIMDLNKRSSMRSTGSRQQKKQVAPNTFSVVLVIVLWPLLAASLIIVLNERFMKVLGLSTQCIWDELFRLPARSFFFMLVEQAILIWGTIDTLGSYSVTVAGWMKVLSARLNFVLSAPRKVLFRIRKYRGQPVQRMQLLKPSWNDPMAQPSTVSHLRRHAILVEVTLWVVFILATLLLLLLESNLINLLRIVGIVTLQTLTIGWTKQRAALSGEMKGSENEMGFGQIMPLLLLILPILSIIQSFDNSKDSDESTATPETMSTHSSRRVSEAQITSSGALIEANSIAVSVNASQTIIGSTGMQRATTEDDEGRMLVARVRTGTDLERCLAPARLISQPSSGANLDIQDGSEDTSSISADIAKLQDALCREPWFLTFVLALVMIYFAYVGLAFQYYLPVA
ncbi:unnamed protein product [Fusarium venenatum]|uniref:Uncharacterized protein n=1 Tax=Fusarium venenatum TaxID=56646 RepID=A0A2L2T630_9HYPO|nr:uncharacterized protein FVRRES_02776 [Fusarium venenatum]CEI66264.1 unnamed protein product [Fusarium venenatum]